MWSQIIKFNISQLSVRLIWSACAPTSVIPYFYVIIIIIIIMYLFLHLLLQISPHNNNCDALNFFFTFLSHNIARSENVQNILWPFSQAGPLWMCETVHCLDETTLPFSSNVDVYSWFHLSNAAISSHNTRRWFFFSFWI